MHKKYLQILEYDKILRKLAGYTAFSASADLARTLTPSPYFSEVQAQQAETAEARHLLSVQPDISVGGATDVRPLLAHAERGVMLTPTDLLAVIRTIIAARDLRRKITRLEDRYPQLADIAYRLEESPGLVNRINQCIDDNGAVKDSASAELTRIRREIDVAHRRLQDKMRRMVASESVRKYLQEGFVTQRDGRYVLPVKADFKGRIKGIVHDQSASGATIFVEPLAVTELNNTWKTLQIEETQEINRILASLSTAVAEQSRFIAATVQALAELDVIFAKARYAETLTATAPTLLNRDTLPANTRRINLRNARHPLLDADTVIPINLHLAPETSMLVITGPNTGGKTVSLKTVGLLALMAQSGLHIPADDGSQLMVFDGIFADIGDEQSLEQSLSTFSAHMTNLVDILSHCTPKSLVIFDELGAGTDPIEGAALAHAILEHLLKKRVTTLVATHYAELKAFAYTTAGVENASMAFNVETLSPTFELQIGVPGNSNAFAIAERLGLPDTILAEAQSLVDEETRETETMLAQIKADMESARMERLRVEEERAEAEYYREKMEKRLENVDDEAQQILQRARREAQKELDATRAKLRELRRETRKKLAEASTARQTGSKLPDRILKSAQSRLETMEAAFATPKARPENLSAPPLKVGQKVEIPHLNAKGVITAINKNEIEVQLGTFRTTLKRNKIHADTQPPPIKTPVENQGYRTGGIVESPGLELDLRGQTADDALHILDSYLDQAYLAGMPFVRIVHGKGTGVLRNAIREALRGHPLVTSARNGADGEGGDGVTVIKLAVD